MKTYKYKVVFLGNYEVGKTTLFRRLKGSSQDDSSSTDSLEMPPFTLEYQITERLQVILEMTDTGSIEKFRGSIPTNYFRNIHAVVLIYDLTQSSTINGLEEWTSDAYSKTADDPSITYALVGNKADKPQDEQSKLRADIFVAKHSIPEVLHFKVSAVSDSTEALEEVFRTLARNIHAKQINRDPDGPYDSGASLIISDEHTDGGKRSCFSC